MNTTTKTVTQVLLAGLMSCGGEVSTEPDLIPLTVCSGGRDCHEKCAMSYVEGSQLEIISVFDRNGYECTIGQDTASCSLLDHTISWDWGDGYFFYSVGYLTCGYWER